MALSLSLSAFAESDWLNFFEQNHSIEDSYTDYHHGHQKWKKDPNYGGTLDKITPKTGSEFESSICGSTFYPAHPLATTKKYHEALYKELDKSKMTGNSYYCQIPGYRKRRCMRAGSFKFVVISDTFVDQCGKHFRAFWVAAYYWSDDIRQTDETVGTLLAKGRNITEDTNSLFKGDYLPINTHEVYKSEFIYFSPLLKGDKRKIRKSIKSAQKSYGLKREGYLFK